MTVTSESSFMVQTPGTVPGYLLDMEREIAQGKIIHGHLSSGNWCDCLIKDGIKTDSLESRRSGEGACDGPKRMSTNSGLCITS